MSKLGITKKAFSIISEIIVYIFVAICLFSVIVSIFSKKDPDGTARILDRQLRFVETESMEFSEYNDVSGYDIGSIRKDSLIVISTVPEEESEADAWYDALEVGDVLTFKYMMGASQVTITHRLIDKDPVSSGGYLLTLKGDNESSEGGAMLQTIYSKDTASLNYVIGKVSLVSYPLGLLITALKSPIGLVFIIIIPCALIIILELIRIMRLFGKEKQKKIDEENEQKDNEIELLKQKLAALEAKAINTPTEPEEKIAAESAPTAPAEFTADESDNSQTASHDSLTDNDERDGKEDTP